MGVICEKLNFQNSKVYELGKNLENRIFGIVELNISMERLPIRDFWAITAASNSYFMEKKSLVVLDISYIVFTLPMPPFGPVPSRDSSLT